MSSIPIIPPVISRPIADTGDVRAIPDTTPTGSNQLSFASGFPPITGSPLTAGGIPPQREDVNAALKLLSQHIFFQQSGGVYPWVGSDDNSSGLNYLPGWIVLGSDGVRYVCIKANGPDILDEGIPIGAKDPVEDEDKEYWEEVKASKLDKSAYRGFPDYANAVTLSFTSTSPMEYVVPDDGWIIARRMSTVQGGNLSLKVNGFSDSILTVTSASLGTMLIQANAPYSKGDIAIISWDAATASFLHFIPAKKMS